eukprot:XP_027303907.1 rano class II histocompatibility antigen, A beta chain-like [Anas platyrhynchos]
MNKIASEKILSEENYLRCFSHWAMEKGTERSAAPSLHHPRGDGERPCARLPQLPHLGLLPPEVTVIWLHNRDIVEPDDYNPISAIPNGDWTYQTQVSLLVAPVAGDTYTCSVQHVSLQEPLLEDWSPGLIAGGDDTGGGGHRADGAGIGLFLARVYRFIARPPAPAASEDPQTDTSWHRRLPVGPISDPMSWC